MNSTVYDIPSSMHLSKNLTPENLSTETFTLTVYFYELMNEQMKLHLAIMTDFSKLRHFSTAIFSETKSVTLNFFSFLE